MKLLILGGTVFVGRHLVEAALSRGHEITLFNRGQHNSDLFPQIEKLKGDRSGNLEALVGRRFDAVIDTCGYFPRLVGNSVRLLKDACDHYTFISSVSVYGDMSKMGVDESAEVAVIADETIEDIGNGAYGALKALCEKSAATLMPGRILNVRPGLIVGPYDPTDRFTYWVRRVNQGGDVLAPGGPDRPVQFIDARDLAAWTITMVEQRVSGTFNATGPDYVLTMGKLLAACNSAGVGNARLVWASDEFLSEMGVEPWTDLPLWIPAAHEMRGFCAINCKKALNAGLTFRPLGKTIADTLAWDASRTDAEELKAGLLQAREKDILSRLETVRAKQ
jgi:2'-hydroxyisoflavone reductase